MPADRRRDPHLGDVGEEHRDRSPELRRIERSDTLLRDDSNEPQWIRFDRLAQSRDLVRPVLEIDQREIDRTAPCQRQDRRVFRDPLLDQRSRLASAGETIDGRDQSSSGKTAADVHDRELLRARDQRPAAQGGVVEVGREDDGTAVTCDAVHRRRFSQTLGRSAGARCSLAQRFRRAHRTRHGRLYAWLGSSAASKLPRLRNALAGSSRKSRRVLSHAA